MESGRASLPQAAARTMAMAVKPPVSPPGYAVRVRDRVSYTVYQGSGLGSGFG